VFDCIVLKLITPSKPYPVYLKLTGFSIDIKTPHQEKGLRGAPEWNTPSYVSRYFLQIAKSTFFNVPFSTGIERSLPISIMILMSEFPNMPSERIATYWKKV